jgi:hypothetical protein
MRCGDARVARRVSVLSILVAAIAAAGCGGGRTSPSEGDGCLSRCTSFGFEECLGDGTFADPVACDDGEVCSPEHGCIACYPGTRYCSLDGEVWQCDAEGSGGEHVETCAAGLTCSAGECKTPCEAALDDLSTVGCSFYAVDLDNESSDILGIISSDAAAQQFAAVVTNNNDYPVDVRVFKNTAPFGQPVVEELVLTRTVAARDLGRLDLPQREVDGAMGQNGPYVKNGGSGTFVSSHAYRIETTGPVTAYQFNPIVQQFSNDASLLLPVQALGRHYYVIGWPTANPCGAPPGDPLHVPSVPDHGAVTIVGVEPGTRVRVVPTHPVAKSGGPSGAMIPATPAGTPIEITVGPYDVVNLESDQPQVPIQQCFNMLDRDGDFTGTIVESDRPVAVFTSLERGAGFGGAQPTPSPEWDGERCCTDHLEEQLLPTTAQGTRFVISRSPLRSTDPSWKEPDLYRVLGTVNGTTVRTNLPGAEAQFTVNAGEARTFAATTGFVMEASAAIAVAQVLVSQRYIPSGGIGDPTMILFPAAEQHRKEYVFLVPATFSKNYMVVAAPTAAELVIDEVGIANLAGCGYAELGLVNGTPYHQVTCPLAEGAHRLASDLPVGLTVYGYYNVGSYGFPGGSDVKFINPVE